MLADVWEELQERWYSTQFGSKERLQFYERAAALLENGVQLKEAITEISNIYSQDGKQRFHPIAMASREAAMGMANGKTLSDAMANWIPEQERSLIAAGQKSGALIRALEDCERLIEARGAIIGAVVNATAYPTFLFALLVYLFVVISYQMVPNMARMSDPEGWTGTAALLYSISEFVTGSGIYVLGATLLLLTLIFASLPYYVGPGRVRLDRMPPWSVYRTLHGSTFLLSFAVMLRAGIKPYDSLVMLAETASPWLRERVQAARYGVGLGQNLGFALRNAGHEFPDREAIYFLCVLAQRKGFADSAIKFSERWMTMSLKQVNTVAALVRNISLLFVGAMMLLVLLGSYEMESIVRAGIQR